MLSEAYNISGCPEQQRPPPHQISSDVWSFVEESAPILSSDKTKLMIGIDDMKLQSTQIHSSVDNTHPGCDKGDVERCLLGNSLASHGEESTPHLRPGLSDLQLSLDERPAHNLDPNLLDVTFPYRRRWQAVAHDEKPASNLGPGLPHAKTGMAALENVPTTQPFVGEKSASPTKQTAEATAFVTARPKPIETLQTQSPSTSKVPLDHKLDDILLESHDEIAAPDRVAHKEVPAHDLGSDLPKLAAHNEIPAPDLGPDVPKSTDEHPSSTIFPVIPPSIDKESPSPSEVAKDSQISNAASPTSVETVQAQSPNHSVLPHQESTSINPTLNIPVSVTAAHKEIPASDLGPDVPAYEDLMAEAKKDHPSRPSADEQAASPAEEATKTKASNSATRKPKEIDEDLPPETPQKNDPPKQDVAGSSLEQTTPGNPPKQSTSENNSNQNTPENSTNKYLPEKNPKQNSPESHLKQSAPENSAEQNPAEHAQKQDLLESLLRFGNLAKQELPEKPSRPDPFENPSNQDAPDEPEKQFLYTYPLKQDASESPSKQDAADTPEQRNAPGNPLIQDASEDSTMQDLLDNLSKQNSFENSPKQHPSENYFRQDSSKNQLPQDPPNKPPSQVTTEITPVSNLHEYSNQAGDRIGPADKNDDTPMDKILIVSPIIAALLSGMNDVPSDDQSRDVSTSSHDLEPSPGSETAGRVVRGGLPTLGTFQKDEGALATALAADPSFIALIPEGALPPNDLSSTGSGAKIAFLPSAAEIIIGTKTLQLSEPSPTFDLHFPMANDDFEIPDESYDAITVGDQFLSRGGHAITASGMPVSVVLEASQVFISSSSSPLSSAQPSLLTITDGSSVRTVEKKSSSVISSQNPVATHGSESVLGNSTSHGLGTASLSIRTLTKTSDSRITDASTTQPRALLGPASSSSGADVKPSSPVDDSGSNERKSPRTSYVWILGFCITLLRISLF